MRSVNFDSITRFLDAIRTEEKRREERCATLDGDIALDQLLFYDQAFLQGFYLLVLVYVWHELEREMVRLTARVQEGPAREISLHDYQQEVVRLTRNKDIWKEIRRRLPVEKSDQYGLCYEVLRPLVNSYKHDPFGKPKKGLLEKLGLDASLNYAALTESDTVREALCRRLRLPANESYSGISDAFVRACEQLLLDATTSVALRPIERRPASLRPATFTR